MTPANVRRILFLLFIALVGLGVYAANHSENSTTSRKVTRIEAASPCLTYGPKSELCKESFEKAVLTITHAEACAILRKAGLEVVECAHARLRQERTRHSEREASGGHGGSTAPAEGEAAPAPGSTGDSGGVSPHTGGKSGGQAPLEPPHQPPSTQPSEPAPAPVAIAPPASQPEQAVGEETTSPAPEASSAPGLIGNPGGVVGEVVCGLNRLLDICAE